MPYGSKRYDKPKPMPKKKKKKKKKPSNGRA